MPRAPFQVAVYPFRQQDQNSWEYALLRRAKEGYWQSIAGGGEDSETPEEAARREAFEETRISPEYHYIALKTMTFVPTHHFKAQNLWAEDVVVIPVYYFAVNISMRNIVLSHEHSEYQWVGCEVGCELLQWDSDKTALWELDQRLHRKLLT